MEVTFNDFQRENVAKKSLHLPVIFVIKVETFVIQNTL